MPLKPVSCTQDPLPPASFTPARLLLCHHGTPGAAAAAALALRIAQPGYTDLIHCLVVPDLWGGMQGDDWLNNASTRDAFGDYVEKLLEGDARRELAVVEGEASARGIAWRPLLRYGDPAREVLAVAAAERPDLVVMGPPRRKGESGLRSRLDLEQLVRGLSCPLLIAPRP
ncbi:MAG: universal stress protein [Chromatiaceae bacterium]|nr:universal stress protein [Candidatus Thioaporhodococcus sediminis]